ncbi:MAG TPA: tRNA 2-thiouridine(34) synthase MnmA [Gammaproteobacteria bacterium]|nr:tRNA 2-thiouridine(34) synthase MnmA [Gammaproteobacteria bacterium]HVC28154.1 tRNA 2-thiouridine(34) synthase MnmA [Gammaproteobacteria bacterium]
MPAPNKTRVIVGLSGGVDSAVAALLLKQQGYAVEGLFMDNWEDDEEQHYCTSAEDFQDARQICEQLGIPLHKMNFSSEYRERVFKYFLDEYAAGRTPNPDVLCNSEIKFKVFLEYAMRLGAQLIATGHYARSEKSNDSIRLLRSHDVDKDQSYFLHAISQQALCMSLFPVGTILKREVRALARDAGFVNHAKKDSTGICFIGERKFRQFLAKYIPAQPGNIENSTGEVLGMHQGLMYYTLGQRQGLGIGGRRESPGTPWYVAAKDIHRNVLVVVQDHDHPLLHQRSLSADNLHWISGTPPAPQFICTAKSRYRQMDQACHVTVVDAQHCRVEFEQPQRALTPGQYVVFYKNDVCLGGCVIDRVGPVASSNRPTVAIHARTAA